MYFEIPNSNIRVVGSMHRVPPDEASMPEWIVSAYEWCEELIMEADTTDAISYMKQPPAGTLQEKLTPDTWAQLGEIWKLPIPLEEMRPWAVLLIAPSHTFQSVDGVEPYLHRRADADAKNIRYLETMDAFTARCDTAPLGDIAQGIESLVADLTKPSRVFEGLHSNWSKGDLNGLYEVAERLPTFQNPRIHDILLRSRNRAWATELSSVLNTSRRTLVVVGALHLVGPDNLLTLLEREVRLVR